MKELYTVAKSHHFQAEVLNNDTIRVWDQDGEIITSSMTELLIWMGY